jgi:hypothetical protein
LRHTVFECAQKILVDKHRFVVAFLHEFELVFETFALVNRIV